MTIKKINSDSSWKIVSSSIVLDPKFAVKELIDNAIDSGAENVYIDVDSKTCGCEYISVRDDGSGVPTDDVDLMCVNHSTSKILSLDDLAKLSTLGFRGEALFSLATLSNQMGTMEITTRTDTELVGQKWSVDQFGEIKNKKKSNISCPRGTCVVVKKLLAGLRSRNIQVSSRAMKNIEEFKNLVNHYSLNYRLVRFHFSLVKLEKNGAICERQLQLSPNINLSKVRLISSIANLRKPVSENFLVENDLELSNLVKLEVILPKMLPHSDIVNMKKPKKFLSVNGRVMSLQLGLGRSFNKMINNVYRQLQLLEPIIWYINVHCPMKIADVNIEPGKDDMYIKDIEFVLERAKEMLTSYISAEMEIDTGKLAGAVIERRGQGEPTTLGTPEKCEAPKSDHIEDSKISHIGDADRSGLTRLITASKTKKSRSDIVSLEDKKSLEAFVQEHHDVSKKRNSSHQLENCTPDEVKGISNQRFSASEAPVTVEHIISKSSSELESRGCASLDENAEEACMPFGRTKMRKLTYIEEGNLLSLQHIPLKMTNLSSRASARGSGVLQQVEKKANRCIFMFCEYTNSCISETKYEKRGARYCYRKESEWLSHHEEASSNIQKGLECYLRSNGIREISLTKIAEGWQKLTSASCQTN